MEFTEVVRKRRMTRSYDDQRPVMRSALDDMLRCAFRAPSAGHTQGRRFLVLDDITSRTLFWDVTSSGPPDAWRRGMQTAPVLVICFADEQAYRDRYAEPDKARSSLAVPSTPLAEPEAGESAELEADGSAEPEADGSAWPIPYWHVDTGMSALILLLAAEDAGLGACFFGVPADRWTALAEAFHVPAGLAPVGVVSLGHPAPDDRSRPLRRRRKTFTELVSYGSFD